MIKITSCVLGIAGVSAMLLITAACGGSEDIRDNTGTVAAAGSDSASDGGSADKATICAGAKKAFSQYGTDAGASGGDLEAFNKAGDKLAATLNGLAGKADGDLKTTLSSMASSWGAVKIDPSDPAGSASKVLEFSKRATEQGKKLASACA
ncbi:MAG TPA: hypothetical protein VIR33_13200 [Thermopolyspora sp.]|jgi:hypothetical protein